jgi:hypothetical protein
MMNTSPPNDENHFVLPSPSTGEGAGEGDSKGLPLTSILSRKRLCRNGKTGTNVMLNLFQHLMESISYETLKRVQGDKK